MEKAKRSQYLLDIFIGANLFILSVLCSWIQLGLRIKDLSLAWLTSSDLQSNYLQSNGILESGSRWQYPRINLATQSDIGSNYSPQFDWLNVAQVKILNYLMGNSIAAVNIGILISFGFTSLSLFLLLRLLKIQRFFSFVIALTFGLLPFHFIRMQHVIVVQYSWVVFLVFLLIVLTSPESLKLTNRWLLIMAAVSAIIISGSGAYAVFYSLLFIASVLVLKTPLLFQKKTYSKQFLCSLMGPILLLCIAASQVLIFRAQKLSDTQNLLYPLRGREDNSKYALRPFELLFPSETSPWYTYTIGWLRNKIVVGGPDYCPTGTFSDYTNRYVCNSSVEGASYGSFFSVIAVVCVIYFGVRYLLLRQGEISQLMRTCLALLVLVLSVATVGGLGTILAGLIPAARKTGVLTPLVFVLFLLIFALIIDNSWHRMRVVPKVLLSLLVLFVLTSESFLTRYNFVEETRDEQEILKEYVSLIDQQIPRKCPILRAPLDLPRFNPAHVSPNEYLSPLYSRTSSWVYVDPAVTNIEYTSIGEAYWWIVGTARSKGYCALELGNRNFTSANSFAYTDVVNFLENVVQLRIIAKSSDSNFRLYSLDSGIENKEILLVNISDGGYTREPVSSGGSWRWVKSKVRYQFFSSIRRCVQIRSHVASFGGAGKARFFLDNLEIVSTPTDVDVTTYVTLKKGISTFRVETSGGNKLLSNGQMGAAYIFDPSLKTVSPDLCN